METPVARARSVAFAAKSALASLVRFANAPGFRKAVAQLQRRKGKILTSGVGKSSYIAMKAAATLTSLGHPATYLNALSALHGDSGIAVAGDFLLAISYSGESVELVKLARHLKKLGVHVIALTGGKTSSLAKAADFILPLPPLQEGSVHNLAPMASTTASLVATDMLAASLTDPKSFSHKSFANFHPGGALGLALTSVGEVMRPRKETPTIREDRTFGEALAKMTKGGLGIVAVVNRSDRLVGALTDGDVRRILLAHDAPKALPVARLMTKHPKSISEGSSLKEALALMETHKITSLFVESKSGKLTSIIHMHDLIGQS